MKVLNLMYAQFFFGNHLAARPPTIGDGERAFLDLGVGDAHDGRAQRALVGLQQLSEIRESWGQSVPNFCDLKQRKRRDTVL